MRLKSRIKRLLAAVDMVAYRCLVAVVFWCLRRRNEHLDVVTVLLIVRLQHSVSKSWLSRWVGCSA